MPYVVNKVLFNEDWSEIVRVDPVAGPYKTLKEALRQRDMRDANIPQRATNKSFDVEEI